MSAPAGLSLVFRLSLLIQDKLAQVSEDISNQPALVLGRSHQNQVSENFGDLECYLAKVDLLILQMALQEVMDLAMNAIGHFNSFEPIRHRAEALGGRAREQGSCNLGACRATHRDRVTRGKGHHERLIKLLVALLPIAFFAAGAHGSVSGNN